MKTSTTNLILILLIVALIIVPLMFLKDAEFEGADDQAGDIIHELDPNYEPWAEPLWEPPSGEIESLLFSVQIAIGALLIGYVIGGLKEKSKHVNNR